MWRRASLLLLLLPAVAHAHPGHGPAIVQVGVGLDNRFDPRSVTVGVGDTVIWRWGSGFNHSVTADDGVFDSGSRTSGEFTHRFTEEGTFGYHCTVHPTQMSGQVTVVSVAGADVEPPRLSQVRVSRRGRRHRIHFTLSERADVLARIQRRKRTVRAFDIAARAGANRSRVRTRGLDPGRYRIALTAFDAADNRSATLTARLRVRRR